MKNRVKMLSAILSAVMVCGLVAGCGNESQGNESSSNLQTEQSQSESNAGTSSEDNAGSDAAEGDVFVVDLWTSDASKEAVLTELVNQYNETTGKENGIELKLTVSAEISNMLQLAQENDELPLLTPSKSWVLYEDGGYNYPIAKMPGGQEFLDEWESKTGEYGLWNGFSGGDDVYMLAHSVGGPALYYNKEMFVAAGIVDENGEAKAPATWSEFLKDCETLTNGTTYGLALPMQWSGYAEYDIVFPGFNTSKEGVFVFDWDNLTVEFNCPEPLRVLAEIYQKGYCVPGAESIDNDPARSYFSEGVAGMFLGYSWDIGVFTSQYVAEFDWGVCQLAGEDGNNYGVLCSMNNWFAPTIAAEKLSEAEQKKLMSVIEWLYGDEVGVALVEAGLMFPANKDHLEKADASVISDVTYDLMGYLANGRIDADMWSVWERVRDNVEYENGKGAILLCDEIQKLCKGETSMEEFQATVNGKFTDALKKAVEEGVLDPEKFK